MQAMTDAILEKAADEDSDQLIRLIEEGAIACDNAAGFPPIFGLLRRRAGTGAGDIGAAGRENQRLYDGNLRNSGKNPPGYPSENRCRKKATNWPSSITRWM